MWQDEFVIVDEEEEEEEEVSLHVITLDFFVNVGTVDVIRLIIVVSSSSDAPFFNVVAISVDGRKAVSGKWYVEM